MTALEARAGMATLEARGLVYVRDGQQILSRVSVSVHPGERLAVTGPSGSGKTSLLTLLAGLDTPSSGEVYIDGIRLTGVAGPGQGVALVLQGYGLVSLLSAAENIEVALRAAGRAPSEAAAAAREALGQVGLGAHADHLVEELSGGQQQRTAVAREAPQRTAVPSSSRSSSALEGVRFASQRSAASIRPAAPFRRALYSLWPSSRGNRWPTRAGAARSQRRSSWQRSST